MEVIAGRKRLVIDRAALERLVAAYREVWLDLGTGNGLFAYDAARLHPQVFVMGLDANRDNLREYSTKARRKPERGGVPNVLFVAGSAERLPAELRGLANQVFINFPWGSLLRGLVAADSSLLAGIGACARPGARLTMLLNFTLFGDDALVAALDVPRVSMDYVRDVMQPAYAAAGFRVAQVRVLAPGEVPLRTAWGRRLTVGGTRDTLQIDAILSEPAPGGGR